MALAASVSGAFVSANHDHQPPACRARQESIESLRIESGAPGDLVVHSQWSGLWGQALALAGALDLRRSNVGIIYTTRGRIAMAITCDQMPEVNWTDDHPGYLMLSRLSLLLIEGLGK